LIEPYKDFRTSNGMQVIYKNENKRYSSRETDSMDVIIYIEEFSKHLKEKHTGGFGRRKFGI